MASNVIHQNRQRHSKIRHNSIRSLKSNPNRQFPQQPQPDLEKLLQHHQRHRIISNVHPSQQQDDPKKASIIESNPNSELSSNPSSSMDQYQKLSLMTSFKFLAPSLIFLRFLALFLMLLTCGNSVSGEGNIGCNFMRTLCIPGSEVCFDDNIFGKCIPTTGVDMEDIDRTPLTEEQSDNLAAMLLVLQGAGLGWDHPYVQCRIQGQLFSMQRHTQLPPSLCANLAPIPNEDDQNGDLAFVRFIPPLEDYADAQDDTDHNLLYYPPMKKQASVDTIFHELQQQELQRQRQFQQPHQSSRPSALDFLEYGGFDDRSFRQPNHSPNYLNPFYENERDHLPPEREYSNPELEMARRKFFRMINDGSMDSEMPDTPPLRAYDSGLYMPDQMLEISQDMPGYYNPYMDPNIEDPRSPYPTDFDLARGRSHRMLKERLFEKPSHPNLLNSFSPNGRDYYGDDTDMPRNDYDLEKQKLYQALSNFDSDQNVPDTRFVKTLERVMKDGDLRDRDRDREREVLFEPFNYKGSSVEESANDYETFKRLENREPPISEPAQRSYFRELAAEQGIEQAPTLAHEALSAPIHNNDEDFDNSQRSRVIDKYFLDSSLVRNSLKPFEEEAILASNPLNRQIKHPKVEKVYTEGGLVIVPQNNYQNDGPFNAYDEVDDEDLEKEKAREFLANMLGFTRHERLDVKKPGPLIGPPELMNDYISNNNDTKDSGTKEVLPIHIKGSNDPNKKKKVIKDDLSGEDSLSQEVDTEYAYVFIKNPIKEKDDAERIMIVMSEILHMQGFFDNLTIQNNGVSFRVNSNNPEHRTASDIAKYINENKGVKNNVLRRLGFTVLGASVGNKIEPIEGDSGVSAITEYAPIDSELTILMIVLIACLIIAVVSLFVLVYHRRKVREKLHILTKGGSVTGVESCSKDYQDLCRARMAGKGNAPEPATGGRIMSLTKENERPPSSRSSTSSWCEEPALTNMDISTGHMVLSYMEDHLRNKGRLQKEWEALCRYEAEPSARDAAQQAQCANFNRPGAPLPYDHSRVVLNHLANAEGLDYINASSITDHDPRAPAYVAAQGPLPTTLAHFWQMIWEQGAVVIVSLCRLQENGEIACARYWPEEGAEVYHIYEVNLVSEHIWCDDYLVRSFYLKNLRTSETRTVTQFHFLSWPANGVPAQAKALLDFRRKVNKSYRGRSCPIVVHGSTGAGRTGAYILLDLVLGRMNKGAREIDIAATLEHLRDQRAGLVATRQQFEFVLMAVAEEVHAILKALPANQSNEKKEIDGANGTNGNQNNTQANATTSSLSNTGVVGVVLKEEESENTEEEHLSPTPPANLKENEMKSTLNKNGTPAKNSANNPGATTTGNSAQRKK